MRIEQLRGRAAIYADKVLTVVATACMLDEQEMKQVIEYLRYQGFQYQGFQSEPPEVEVIEATIKLLEAEIREL